MLSFPFFRCSRNGSDQFLGAFDQRSMARAQGLQKIRGRFLEPHVFVPEADPGTLQAKADIARGREGFDFLGIGGRVQIGSAMRAQVRV